MLGGYYLGQLYLGLSGGFGGTGSLTVQDSNHSHTVDNVTLVQQHTIVVSDSLHGHTVDSVVLIEHKTLVVNDTTHGHTADNVVLIQQHTLVVNDSSHGHTVDNVVLIQQHAIVVADALHGLSSETPTLNQYTLIEHVNDANHGLTSDSIVLIQNFTLDPDDSYHSVISDNISRIINWDELGLFFGIYIKDFKADGSFSEIASVDDGILIKKQKQLGSFETAQIDSGVLKRVFDKQGQIN